MSTTALAAVIRNLLLNMHRTGIEEMGEKIEDLVQKHSIGAACSGFAAALLPGAGSTIAITISAGFVWSMYYRINQEINVPFSKNIVKSVGTAICTNIAMSYATAIAAQILVSFIPGLNAVGALVIGGACYGATWCSGLIYLKVLLALTNKGLSFENVSEEELRRTAEDVLKNTDIDAAKREAEAEYESAKARGDINKNNKFNKEEGFD